MPIYEYACNSCEHVLDALQKINDAPLRDCPECGEPQLKRLISAPRFRLKGDGWYETDFKKDNQRNVLKSDSEPPKSADKSDTKSDTGSATKSDAKTAAGKSASTPAKTSGNGKSD